MDINRVINIVSAGLVAFGILLAFQAGLSLASDRKAGRPSTGGQWWELIEGIIFVVLGGLLSTILAPILAA